VCVVETAGNERIGDEGVILIAQGLEKNTSLKELRLFGVFRPHLQFSHCFMSYTLLSSETLLFDVNE
jgi:hypothetical protein